MPSVGVFLAIVCLGCPWVACREPLAAAPAECPGDTVAVIATATVDGPKFSWTPACPITMLNVEVGNAGWAVEADSDRIVPPVRYGQKPTGATLVTVAPTLVHGDSVVVRVWRWYSADLSHQAGTLTFVY